MSVTRWRGYTKMGKRTFATQAVVGEHFDHRHVWWMMVVVVVDAQGKVLVFLSHKSRR